MSNFDNSAEQSIIKSKLANLKKPLDYHAKTEIWAIGGGKGGVGKSLVTANLSISLALMGHKVVSIDLDLGGANLHTCLGVPIPDRSLSDFITKKVNNFEELITQTNIPNLFLVSGAQDELRMASLKNIHRNKILTNIENLDAQYVLIDLGAGTTLNTLDFFISAKNGLLVVLPEPTSIENTYRFIKSIYFRRLQLLEDLYDLRPLIDQVMNAKINTPNSSPAELVNRIVEMNPQKGQKLKKEIEKFRPKLIMNQVRGQGDIELGFSIKSICKKYFGIEIDYVGFLEYDSSVWQSVKRRKPLLTEFPHSKLSINFDKIVQRLIN